LHDSCKVLLVLSVAKSAKLDLFSLYLLGLTQQARQVEFNYTVWRFEAYKHAGIALDRAQHLQLNAHTDLVQELQTVVLDLESLDHLLA